MTKTREIRSLLPLASSRRPMQRDLFPVELFAELTDAQRAQLKRLADGLDGSELRVALRVLQSALDADIADAMLDAAGRPARPVGPGRPALQPLGQLVEAVGPALPLVVAL